MTSLRPWILLVFLALFSMATAAEIPSRQEELLAQTQGLGVELTALTARAASSGDAQWAQELAQIRSRWQILSRLTSRLDEPSQDLLRKQHAVLVQWNLLATAGKKAASPEALSNRETFRTVSLGSNSSDCAKALILRNGDRLRGMLASGAGIWLKLETDTDTWQAVDGAGSQADTQLDVFSSACPRADEMPMLSSDDGIGLAPRLSVFLQRHQPRFVHLVNRGALGEFALSVQATGAITGHVYDERNNQLITSATILIYATDGTLKSNFYTSTGIYSSSLAPGNYLVRVETNNSSTRYVSELYPDAPCDTYDGLSACALAQAQSVQVVDGQATSGIDFHLNIGGQVLGQVRASGSNLPIVGAELQLFSSSGTLLSYKYTDGAGRYQFDGLLTANYYIEVTADGFASQMFDHKNCFGPVSQVCYPLASDAVAVVRDTNRSGVDFSLTKLASIRGTVTKPSLDPYEPCCTEVHVLDAQGVEVRQVQVGQDGTYVAGPLAPGDYYAFAASSRYFSQLFNGIDCFDGCAGVIAQAQKIHLVGAGAEAVANFALKAHRSLSGRMTDVDSGSGLQGVVDLRNAAQPTSSYMQVQADSQGYYRFPSLPPGDYYVVAHDNTHQDIAYPNSPCEAASYYYNGCDASTGSLVHMGSQDVLNLDMALHRNGEIRGQVNYRVPGLATSGFPVYYSQVLLYLDQQLLSTTSASIDGSYVFADLAPGHYVVTTSSNDDHFGQIFPHLDCDANCDQLTSAQTMVLTLGEVRNDVSFDLVGKRIVIGRVTDAQDSHGVPGVVLDLWNADDLTHSGSTFTREDGYYVLGRDTYYYGSAAVKVSTDAGSGYVNQVFDHHLCPQGPAYYGKCSLEGAQLVSLPNLVIEPPMTNFVLDRTDPDKIFSGGFE